MFFGKKSKKEDAKCSICNKYIDSKFNFCPHCGSSLVNPEEEMKELGLLGKNDYTSLEKNAPQNPLANLGITDKLINSLVSSLAKSLDKQFRDMSQISPQNTEIRSLPNGIKIRIGTSMPSQQPNEKKPKHNPFAKTLTAEQLEKISSLPRVEAKTDIKRFSKKVIFELNAPGIESIDDVLLSKVESGYEIKAIGKKKIYVNNIPINLPLRSYSIEKDKVLFEFKTE